MPQIISRKRLAFYALGLTIIVGCEQTANQKQPGPQSDNPSTIAMDDLKQNAVASPNATANYSQELKDKLYADMKAKMEVMDENIERLRQKGKNLESDAKTRWDLKMAALDEKRKLANERLAEVGESTSKAWSDIENGVMSAWEELSKALQQASVEF